MPRRDLSQQPSEVLPGPGTVVSVNLSARKTVRKTPGTHGTLVLDRGFEGDAHAGDWHRQVSLLAEESIGTMVAKGLDVAAGDFAENITTRGIDLMMLPVGSVLRIGRDVVLEVSQIGKVCHTKCAIYYQAGDCVMPREGVFAVVREAGDVDTGDVVEAVSLGDGTCDRTPQEAIREFEEERAKEAALQAHAVELGLDAANAATKEGES
jgi:MOSC domain-containing protein YiiM